MISSTSRHGGTCFYPKRNGDYVYDVTVAKDEAVRLSHRYRAHLDHAERIENGQLTPVQVEVADAYGPTVAEAIRALDAWPRADPKGRRFRTSVISDPAVRAPAFRRQPFTVGVHVGLVLHEIGPVYLMVLAILGAAMQGFMLALQVSQSCFEPFAFGFQMVRHLDAQHMLSAEP